MLTRRAVAALLLALALPARAQGPARIAWIGPGSASGHASRLAAFRDGLREQGMLDGATTSLTNATPRETTSGCPR